MLSSSSQQSFPLPLIHLNDYPSPPKRLNASVDGQDGALSANPSITGCLVMSPNRGVGRCTECKPINHRVSGDVSK